MPGVNRVQSFAQLVQALLHRAPFRGAVVHQVIGHAAKGIQRDAGGSHAGRQQAAGGKKGFGAAAHQINAGVQVALLAFKAAGLVRGGRKGHGLSAHGSVFPETAARPATN